MANSNEESKVNEMKEERNNNSRSSKNRKRGKQNSKQKGSGYDDYAKGKASEVDRNTGNDPSWYTRTAQLTIDTASIPQHYPLGLPIHMLPTGVDDNAYSMCTEVMPGIMTLELLHGPGIANFDNDAVNLAARSIYSFIRSKISGSRPYDPADYMMYCNAMAEAYAWLCTMERAYGVAQLYVMQNRYYPKALLYAMGFDAEDIMDNLTQFRKIINLFARGIGSFAVPNDILIFDRLKFLYSNYFIDGDNTKAQTYVCVPAVIRRWDETGDTGSELVPLPLHSFYQSLTPTIENPKIDLERIKNACDYILNGLFDSEDVGTMSGDTLRAFGENNLWSVEMLPDDYLTMPVVDPGMLHQIMNATVWSDFDYDSAYIKQNVDIGGGEIVYRPNVRIKARNTNFTTDQIDHAVLYNLAAHSRVLNAYMRDIDPSSATYITRLTSCASNIEEAQVDGSYQFGIHDAGLEICVGMHITTLGSDSLNSPVNGADYRSISYLQLEKSVDGLVDDYAKLCAFNYHPTIYVLSVTSVDGVDRITRADLIQQWENNTCIEQDTISGIHDAAIYSLWKVPQVGLYTG
jgi:hypothetical protein